MAKKDSAAAPDTVSIKQAAEDLGVTVRWIRAQIAAEVISPARAGSKRNGRFALSAADVETLAARAAEDPSAGGAAMLARFTQLEGERANLLAQVAWERAIAQEQQKALEAEHARVGSAGSGPRDCSASASSSSRHSRRGTACAGGTRASSRRTPSSRQEQPVVSQVTQHARGREGHRADSGRRCAVRPRCGSRRHPGRIRRRRGGRHVAVRLRRRLADRRHHALRQRSAALARAGNGTDSQRPDVHLQHVHRAGALRRPGLAATDSRPHARRPELRLDDDQGASSRRRRRDPLLRRRLVRALRRLADFVYRRRAARSA